MLEIYLISYLAISVPVTFFLLLVFRAARRADDKIDGVSKECAYKQPDDQKAHIKRSIPSFHV